MEGRVAEEMVFKAPDVLEYVAGADALVKESHQFVGPDILKGVD